MGSELEGGSLEKLSGLTPSFSQETKNNVPKRAVKRTIFFALFFMFLTFLVKHEPIFIALANNYLRMKTGKKQWQFMLN